MRRQLAEVAAIAGDPAPPSFDNTIIPMERSGELLTRAVKVFLNITQMDTNDALQKVKADLAPKLAAHQDAIFLNPKLFVRVQAVYDRRDALGPEEKYLVERTYRNFVRAGAKLGDADKASLTRLNQEESTLSTDYTDKILAETNASAVIVDDRAQLDGLSEGDLAAAAEAAKEKGLAGKWLLALQNTTQQPLLQSLKNRGLRERLFEASIRRGNHGGPNDTRALIQRLAGERAERARLLGFPSFAAYVLDDQMAKTPENALRLMTGLVPASTAKAREEAARIQRPHRHRQGVRRVRVAGLRLGFLRGEGPQGRIRSGRIRDPSLPRAGPRAPGRRLLRGEPALRDHVPRAHGHPGLQPRRARLRGVRRGRQAARALLRRLLRASQQAGRRLAGELRRPERPARHEARRRHRPQLHQAGARAEVPPVLRGRHGTLPRVRARAARHVRERALPHALERAARLRRVPLSDQRALGARAGRLRQLREASRDRRAHALAARREDQEVQDVQPGVRRRPSTSPRRCSTSPGTSSRPARRRRTWTPSRARR